MELRKAMEEFKAIMNNISNKILKEELPAEPHNYGRQEDCDEIGRKRGLRLLKGLLRSNMPKRLVRTYNEMKVKAVIFTTD